MSEPAIHWVEAGDSAAARKHGLTLLAMCGTTFIPDRMGVAGPRPSCADCEALNGPIDRNPRKPRAENDRPHFVYRHYGEDGRLLYVGCTVDPKTRQLSHQQNSWWFPQAVRARLTIYPARLHALRVERNTIRDEKPLWNVRHQDFSSWPREQLHLGRDMAVNQEAPEPVVRRFLKLAGAA